MAEKPANEILPACIVQNRFLKMADESTHTDLVSDIFVDF